jgi:hypothetical protein
MALGFEEEHYAELYLLIKLIGCSVCSVA